MAEKKKVVRWRTSRLSSSPPKHRALIKC